MTSSFPTVWLVIVCLTTALAAGCAPRDSVFNAHLQSARSLAAADDYERARVELRNALRIEPRDADALRLAAEVAEALGEWRAAAQFHQNVLTVAPDDDASAIGLARIHVMAGQPDEAAALTGAVLRRQPGHIQALTTHASALAQSGSLGAAMVHVNTVLRLEESNEEGVALLAWLLERTDQREAALASLRSGLALRPDSRRLLHAYGELALAMERIDLAVDAQRRLIELQPQRADPHYRLAQLLLREGRVEDAERGLRLFMERNPNDLTARLFLTEAIARQSRLDDARSGLTEFLRMREDVPELRLLLADLYERDGAIDEALVHHRRAIDELGDQPVALAARTNIARILIGRGETRGARGLLDEVLELNPRDAEALTLSAFLHLRRGQPAAAVAELRSAHESGSDGFVVPLLAQALWGAGDCEAAVALLRDSVTAGHSLYLLARYLHDTGRSDESLALTRRLLDSDPQSVAALELLVAHALHTGDADEAAFAAARIVAIRPDQPLGYHLGARAALAADQPRTAEEQLREALRLAPDAVEPLELLVDLLLDDERTDDARRVLETVIAQRPRNAIAHWWLGRVAVATGDVTAGRRHFRRAADMQPDWSRPWASLAQIARALGQLEEAETLARAGIDAGADTAALGAELAATALAGGDVDGAIGHYRALLQAQPDEPALLNNLAMLLVAESRGDQDLLEARMLIQRLRPGDDPRLLDTVARVYAKSCELPRAAAAHRDALRLDPDNGAYRLRLATVYADQGNVALAQRELALLSAAELTPELARRRDALQRTLANANDTLSARCASPTDETRS